MSRGPEHKSHATAWTITLLLLMVLYVLSYGPVMYLTLKGVVPPDPKAQRETFYKPLYWLQDNTPLREPLHSYELWWVGLARKP